MNFLAAAMLIALGGKNPDEESIKKVLREAGAKADEANIKKFVSEIKGKDVQKLALEGLKKLGAGSAPAAVEAKPVEKKEEKKAPAKVEKKEEKKVEPPPEEDEGGFGDLFG